MSMFHELMMRKKEEIMYATIKGTLTENDGVFSGFSNTNYLQTQQTFDVSQTNWEFVIKASKASTGNARLFCINNGNGAMHTIFSLTSFSCTILTTTLTISQNFTADNFYFFKIKRNGNILSLSWSSDGIIYQDEQSAEVTNWGNSGYVFYGRVAGLSTAGFGGSIDLNNSYIKIGATKYNLQAVVGYTVVGSPTITDGVVSGFSSANYLYLPPAPSWSNIDILETFTTFTTSTMNTLQIVMGGRYSQATCCVEITSANKTLFRITYIDSGGTTRYKETTVNYVLSANTKYKVKNYFNKQTLVIKSELYDENGIMLASASSSLASDYTFIANINDFWYGYNTQRGTFNGSIDFNNNNTYVKINNKLWFNGQQA